MNSRHSMLIAQALTQHLSRRMALRIFGGLSGAATLGGVLLGPIPQRAAAQDFAVPPLLQPSENEEDQLRSAEFFDRLSQVGSLDYETGRVQVDGFELRAVLEEYLPEDLVDGYHAGLVAHAELGFAVAGAPEEVAAARGVVVPWMMVGVLASEEGQNYPPDVAYGVMEDLGVLDATSAEEVEAILNDRFPNVPARIPERPRDVDTGGIGISTGEAILKVLKDFRDKVVPAVPPSETRSLIDCFAQATWVVNWFGWQCCFDPSCAAVVANSALDVGLFGGGTVVPALKAILTVVGIAAAPAGAIALAISLYLAVMGSALGLSLQITPNSGACLGGNWPIITPFIIIPPWVVPMPRL